MAFEKDSLLFFQFSYYNLAIFFIKIYIQHTKIVFAFSQIEIETMKINGKIILFKIKK